MGNEQMNNQNPKRKPSVTFTKPILNKAPAKTNSQKEDVKANVVEGAKEVEAKEAEVVDTSKATETTDTVSQSTPSPKKPKSGKGKAVTKSIVFGSLSAAAVAGITLGAIFLNKPKEYVLTYVINGEVVEVDVNEDSLLSNVPAPSVTGYSFDGWYLDPTYTTKLTSGYSFTGDVSLYPKFTPNKYTVTYYSNNGVGGVYSQDVYFNSEYNTILNTFEKPNYTFVGWSTNANTRYDDANIIPQNQVALLDTEGIALYAVWRGVDRNIVFDTTDMKVNGGAYTMQPATIPHGEEYTLPTITGTITNDTDNLLKFAGYTINGNVYQPGSKITITDNTNIAINWQSASSVLNFNIQAPNGETISNISPMAFYTDEDSYSYLNLPTPDTATNYEFIGWNTSADGTGTTYLTGETFTTDSATSVLYAMWQGKSRKIYIYNGGSVVDTINCRYGDTVTLPSYALDKYTFVGFNDAHNYTGTSYSGNIVVQFADEEVNLYAEYSRNQITVSFNANGGVGSIDNITINSEELYSLSATDIANQRDAITRRYYTLAGWSTDQNADPSTASFDISAGTTNLPLYAIWSRNQVQVTYAPNMDSTVPVSHKIDQGTDYTFTETGFAKEGYYIVEFKVNGTSYKAGDIIPAVEVDNLRVEVVWKKIEKVLFKNAGNISTVETVSGDTVTVEDVTAGTKIIAPYVTLENSYKTNANGDRVYFAGWATTENATKPTVFARSTELTITDSQQIFYAVYMEASVELDYVYDSNTDTYAAQLKDELNTLEEENYVLVIPNTYDGKAVTSIYSPDLFKTWWSSPIKSIIISEGVAGFGGPGGAFKSSPVENVTLPNSLKEIGQSAFDGCNKISKLIIPDGVETIKSSAFLGCGIGTLFISNSVKTIESQQFIGFESIIFEEGSTITSLSNAFQSASHLKNITIPDSVTDISCAFRYCTKLESIVIPSGVTNIQRAFENCAALSSVTLPSNLTEIGSSAFGYCANLKNITIPNSVTTIKSGAFSSSGLESIELPNTITIIEDCAFQSCTNLKNINIPTSVTSIGSQTFADAGIESLVLHNGITKIGAQAFMGSDISSINIPTQVTSISFGLFSRCANLKNITIPDNITSIANEAFKGSGLESITIPSGVTTIGTCAFEDVISLTSVTINTDTAMTYADHFSGCPIETVTYGEGVTSIPDSAWNGCTTLTTVNLPSGLTSIGEGAFAYTGINSMVLPESIESIGDYAFYSSEISSINIPTSLTSIGLCWFYNCKNLKNIVIPDNITYIGEASFGCTGLESIIIPSSVTGIYPHAFHGCKSLKSVTINTNYAITYDDLYSPFTTANGDEPENDCPIETVTYGEGVTSIPDNAWDGCESLKKVVIPEGVATIGNNAFWCCTNLNEVTIPEGVTTIGEFAFWTCASLTEIVIPSSVTSVGSGAFENCAGLTDITINTNTAITHYDHFDGSDSIATITYGEGVTMVPYNAWADCKSLTSVTLPSSLTTIGEFSFSYCDSLQSITIPSGVTTIGTSAFEDGISLTSVTINTNTAMTYANHFSGCPIETVTYGEGVTSIPDNAWGGAYSVNSVTLPSTLETIGDAAFGVTAISTINLPEGLLTIGAYAFDSSSLSSIIIPSTVTTIGEGAFVDTDITNITIPSSVTSVGSGAFNNCRGLQSITINTNATITFATHFNEECTSLTTVAYGEGVTSIPDNAWAECESLTTLSLPSTLETVGSRVFYNCVNLNDVTISDGVKNIGTEMFYGCSRLTYIEIPGSVTTIENSAFGYSGLEEVVFNEGLLTIGEQAFEATSITSVILPVTLEFIGMRAFVDIELAEIVIYNTTQAIPTANDEILQVFTVTQDSIIYILSNPVDSACLNFDSRIIDHVSVKAIYYDNDALESLIFENFTAHDISRIPE